MSLGQRYGLVHQDNEATDGGGDVRVLVLVICSRNGYELFAQSCVPRIGVRVIACCYDCDELCFTHQCFVLLWLD